MRDLTYPPVIVSAKLAFRLLRQRFQMSGTDNVPRHGGALLAINHTGYVDFIYAGLGANPSKRLVRFMIKREMMDHRWLGPLLRSFHHIRVDRADGGAALEQALGYLRAGEVVGIYPEATISRSFEIKGAQDRCRPARRRGRRTAGAGDRVGRPPADDQGPPQGLLPLAQDDRHPGRRAAAPHRRRPGRRDGRAAGGHAADARRGDRRLPGGGAAAGLVVDARPVRRLRAHPGGGGPAGRRGAGRPCRSPARGRVHVGLTRAPCRHDDKAP
ncbi:lysophospholipid acyltransferase family protein [Nocardioides sp. TF02-7]|uniref:lysophospholipid acyltransferase family protein n=1 Tax=Nocardioides sp. TF02-7 TaxID=2917724 RepID=UPI001F0702C6|nr:lysophospholipid acyltransferase family protein [Nocardioides sp. TF02-7]UMG94189.1 1-acyl-sn-glycerol-3-phosphate acyltransferase [Nocardioides sp. TF02-7]